MRTTFFAMGAILMAYSDALKLTAQDSALFETDAFFNEFAQADSL